MTPTPYTDTSRVAIIGGRMAGLAAGERFAEIAGEVTLYERDDPIGDPVDCGEGITSPSLIPIDKTPENGFVNECPNFVAQIKPCERFGWSGELLAETRLVCDPAYVTDRGEVERSWADRLRDRGVTIHTGHAVSRDEYEQLRRENDVVVDASGNPSVTMKWNGLGAEYGSDMVALNADVEGDFSPFYPEAWVIFEGYKGYFWVFPKSESRANVGIGWMADFAREQNLNYREELFSACERNYVPKPDAEAVSVYTIPSGPALDREYLHWEGDGEADVYLVGDAAGLANRYQGEGITQAIHSSYLLGDLIEDGKGEQYPDRLWEHMLSEFRLAHIMKGAWDEHEDPRLLAAMTRAMEGLTLHEVTREPRKVYARLARHPVTSARLFSNRGILRRVWTAYTNSWEFGRA